MTKRIISSLMVLSLLVPLGCSSKQTEPLPKTETAVSSQTSSSTPPSPNDAQSSAPVEKQTAPDTAKSDSVTEKTEKRVKPIEQPAPSSVPVAVTPAKPASPDPTTPPTAATSPAPEPTQAPAVQEAPKRTLSLSIVGDSERGNILPMTQIEVAEGDTVLDVLKRATQELNIPIKYRGTGSIAYIEGIGNLFEFDRGPKSGWMFKVNGAFGGKSAGSVRVNPGDKVEWLYTLNLGKDLNGGKMP
jgi:outer membrane biosynthesis protein TonB